jgi:hypothetical protein
MLPEAPAPLPRPNDNLEPARPAVAGVVRPLIAAAAAAIAAEPIPDGARFGCGSMLERRFPPPSAVVGREERAPAVALVAVAVVREDDGLA